MADDSNDVNEFLLRIKELGEKTDREDELRAKKLEETILEGRRRRQALKNERTRSLSPEKRLNTFKDATNSTNSSANTGMEYKESFEEGYLKNSSRKEQLLKTKEFLVGPKMAPKQPSETVPATYSKLSNQFGNSIDKPILPKKDFFVSKSPVLIPPSASRKSFAQVNKSKPFTIAENNIKSHSPDSENKIIVGKNKNFLLKSNDFAGNILQKPKPRVPSPSTNLSSDADYDYEKKETSSSKFKNSDNRQYLHNTKPLLHLPEVPKNATPAINAQSNSSSLKKITSADIEPEKRNSSIIENGPETFESSLTEIAALVERSSSPLPLPRRAQEFSPINNSSSLLNDSSSSYPHSLSNIPDLSPVKKTPTVLTRTKYPSPTRGGGSFVQSALKRSGTTLFNSLPIRNSKSVPDFLDGSSLANDLKKSLGEASPVGKMSQAPKSNSENVEQIEERPRLPKRPNVLSRDQNSNPGRFGVKHDISSEGSALESQVLPVLPPRKEVTQMQQIKPVPPPSRFKNISLENKKESFPVIKDDDFKSSNASLGNNQKPSVDKIRELLDARKAQVHKNLKEEPTMVSQKLPNTLGTAKVIISTPSLNSSPIPELISTEFPENDIANTLEQDDAHEDSQSEDHSRLTRSSFSPKNSSGEGSHGIVDSLNRSISQKQPDSRRWKSPVRQTWLESALKKNSPGHQQSPGSPDFSIAGSVKSGLNRSESMVFANRGVSRSPSPTKLNYSSSLSFHGISTSGSPNKSGRSEGSFLTTRGQSSNGISSSTREDKEKIIFSLPNTSDKSLNPSDLSRQVSGLTNYKPPIIDPPVKPSKLSSPKLLPTASSGGVSHGKSTETVSAKLVSPPIFEAKPAILLPGEPIVSKISNNFGSVTPKNPAVLTPPIKPLSLSLQKFEVPASRSPLSNRVSLKPTIVDSKTDQKPKTEDIEAFKRLRTLKPSVSPSRCDIQGNKNEVNNALSKLKSDLKRSNTSQFKSMDEDRNDILSMKGQLRSAKGTNPMDPKGIQISKSGNFRLPNSLVSSSETSPSPTRPAFDDFIPQLSSIIKRGPLAEATYSKISPSLSTPSSPKESPLNFGNLKKSSTFDSAELSESKPLKHLTKGRAKGPQRRLPNSVKVGVSSDPFLKDTINSKSNESVEELKVSKIRGSGSQNRVKMPPAIRSSSRVVSGKFN
ncbi:hypothetical protein NADFUDRAFT_78750 [Nadsonia fulvescens var. elongata DSM 6958]|uniref:DUF4045 domain-containing protein n=1 Tax=Nadsonia fulvescens var. elongata DSM 6958 TaxID=857566 RepID=A0A1E3PKY9_9ASCO|nr:hypothetical protein NADFUDRAFT_78750 [Nadsonia fulvescens var. elongata DSM 6958]